MLKKIITQDSELVRQLLVRNKSLTIPQLQELTGYQDIYICFTIGWLLKENKIICSDNAEGLTFAPDL